MCVCGGCLFLIKIPSYTGSSEIGWVELTYACAACQQAWQVSAVLRDGPQANFLANY